MTDARRRYAESGIVWHSRATCGASVARELWVTVPPGMILARTMCDVGGTGA